MLDTLMQIRKDDESKKKAKKRKREDQKFQDKLKEELEKQKRDANIQEIVQTQFKKQNEHLHHQVSTLMTNLRYPYYQSPVDMPYGYSNQRFPSIT